MRMSHPNVILLFSQGESPGFGLALHLRRTCKSYGASGGQKATILSELDIVWLNCESQHQPTLVTIKKVLNSRQRTQMWWLTGGLSQVSSLTTEFVFNIQTPDIRWWRRQHERPWRRRRGALESKPRVQLPRSQL